MGLMPEDQLAALMGAVGTVWTPYYRMRKHIVSGVLL